MRSRAGVASAAGDGSGGRGAASSRRLPGASLGAAFGTLLALAWGPAEAYRFFDGRGDDRPLDSWRLVDAADALRWSSEAWGPGETLEWVVAPDPDFETLFGDADGVLPDFRDALAAWSDLPSVDISWRVRGVGEASEEEPGGKDDENSFFVDAESPWGGYARLWSERAASGESWEMTECDFTLGSWVTEEPPSDYWRAQDRAFAVYVILHELGHCLGLAHSASLSVSTRTRAEDTVLEELVHPRDPVMSYGVALESPLDLSPDDVVAASLLRPASGWEAMTGTISGTLRLDAEPAAWVPIWALPLADDPVRDRVGGFSDQDGVFRIEGLAPGEYLLWSQVIVTGAHGLLMLNGAPVDLDDTVLPLPVRVEAGQRSDGVEIPLRIGRTTRPLPADPASRGSFLSLAVTDHWGTPCAGVRLRAERPWPADGPRSFSADTRLEGDIWLATRLVMEWPRTAGGVVFDWAGLYRSWTRDRWLDRIVFVTPPRTGARWLDLDIVDWQVRSDGSTVRHVLEIAWPESAEAGLRFRSGSGACQGEPMVACNITGCEVRR